jgi:hypothetical protein
VAIVVIGGQSRDVGKTGVVCALIAAMPEHRWTAIKIAQCSHGGAATCDCELAGRAVAVSEESDATRATDSSRFLAAGAMRSLWVRTRRGRLIEAMPQIRVEIARACTVIFGSNSILGFLRPDLYATVLDPRIADFKASATQYLERADAILVAADVGGLSNWPDVSREIQRFRIAQPDYRSVEFAAFVARKLAGAEKFPASLRT